MDKLKNGIKYLDLTANNYGYGSVPAMDMEAFTLLIKPGNQRPEYLDPKFFTARNLNRKMLIEIDEENGIQVEKIGYRTGTLAAGSTELQEGLAAFREKRSPRFGQQKENS